MPSRIIEFADGITQSQIGNLGRTNVFDASMCLALQKGVEPKLLSNMNDVFRLIDPLNYYVGHPQSTLVPVGASRMILNYFTPVLRLLSDLVTPAGHRSIIHMGEYLKQLKSQ